MTEALAGLALDKIDKVITELGARTNFGAHIVVEGNNRLERIYCKHPNDIRIREGTKRLGILLTREGESSIALSSPSGEALVRAGDHILEFQLPPIKKRDRGLKKAHQSFRLLAQYIQRHNLDTAYILGTTYERLAVVAQGFGFKIDTNYQFSEAELRRFEKKRAALERCGLLPKNSGEPRMIYQSTADFIKRFGEPVGD